MGAAVGQHHERAGEHHLQRGRVRRSVPDRQPLHHHIREQRVGEAEEGEHEYRDRPGEWLPLRGALAAREPAGGLPHPDARRDARQGQEHQAEGAREIEPLLAHRVAEERSGHAHQRHAERDPGESPARPGDRLALKRPFAAQDEPGGPEQHVAAAQPAAHEQREQLVAEAGIESRNVAPEHVALRERGDEGAEPEQPVPQLAVPAFGLDAELERHAAQHEADQHRDHRKVEGAEDHPVRHRERDQQQSHAEHEPGLVRVPEGRDRRDHHALFVGVARGHEHADAEVVAVQHDVGEDRRAHQHGEHERQVERHAGVPARADEACTADPPVSSLPPLPARWVSTTM